MTQPNELFTAEQMQVIAEIARHEAGHVVVIAGNRERDRSAWRGAADYAINPMFTEAEIDEARVLYIRDLEQRVAQHSATIKRALDWLRQHDKELFLQMMEELMPVRTTDETREA